MTKRFGLIDYDIIVYQMGHVSDAVSYHLPNGQSFKYKKDAKSNYDGDPDDIARIITPEPVEYCLNSVKLVTRGIVKAAGKGGKFKGYLTASEGNYRCDIDSIQPYKGHRPSNKPTWYNEIREYLVDYMNGEVIEGMEADDAMGIAQSEAPKGSTIIATIDKDLDMIEGWHYNWNKKKLYEVSPIRAIRFFYFQLLTGDRADNIKGLYGVGDVTAEDILVECHSEQEMFDAVCFEYEKRGVGYYDMLENGNLLWILQKENKHWNPTTLMNLRAIW